MDFSLLPPLQCRYYSAWEREITAPGPGKGEGGGAEMKYSGGGGRGWKRSQRNLFFASPLHTFRSSRCNDLYYHQPSSLLRRSSVHTLTPTKDNPFIEDCGVYFRSESLFLHILLKDAGCVPFFRPLLMTEYASEGGGEMCVVGVGSGGESRRRKSWGGATSF